MDLGSYVAELNRSGGPGWPAWGPENRVVLARVDSTNLLARRVVAAYQEEEMAPPELLVLALEQTAGRGRQGRSWLSPAGAGVYGTRLLTVAEAAQLQTVPLLAAVGLARAVGTLLSGGACGLEWPNDLVVGRRKLGGVLVESIARAEGGAVAMIGFGVNYRFGGGGESEGVAPGLDATSLDAELDDPPPLGTFARVLVEGLERELVRLGDVARAIRGFRELTVHRSGDPIHCLAGGEVVSGVFAGFDDRGFLRLEREGEERLIAAGEIVEEAVVGQS